MVLGDGTMLAPRGLDRERGIVFRISQKLRTFIPDRSEGTPSAIAEAMRFLTDDWPGDVATSYQGKCVLIALTLTPIERFLLPERPAFFVTAGQRGGGKTTTVNMITMAILGHRATAAAWSPSEEERRKALLAYLIEGVPTIVWDNIPCGAQISCPSIEKAPTILFYGDRLLGVNKTRT